MRDTARDDDRRAAPKQLRDSVDLRVSSYLFVEAKNMERRERYYEAFRFYKGAFSYDPYSEYLMDLLPEYAVQLNLPEEAVNIISQGKGRGDWSDTIVRQAMGIYRRTAGYEKIPQFFEYLEEPHFYDTLVYLDALEKTARHMEAITVYKKIAESSTIDSLVSLPADDPGRVNPRDFDIQIGDLYRREELYDSALVYYEKARTEEETRLPALRGIALSKYFMGENIPEAVARMEEVYAEALEESVYFPVLMELLAWHYASVEQEYVRAVEILTPLYQYVLSRENRDLLVYYGKALVLFMNSAELFEQSENLLTELRTYSDTNFYLLLYSGITATSLGKVEEAERWFNRAFSTEDVSTEDLLGAYRYAIWNAVAMEQNELAHTYIYEMLDRFPGSPHAYYIAGVAQMRMGEYSTGVGCFGRAAELSKDDFSDLYFSVLFQKAVAHDSRGDFSAAEEILEEIIAQDSTQHLAANYLGYSWAERGENLDKALRLLELALSQEPTNGAYLDSYAWILYQKGEYEEALTYITKAVRYLDEHYVVHYHTADILVQLGRYDEAQTSYEEALRLIPEGKEDDRRSITEKLNTLKDRN